MRPGLAPDIAAVSSIGRKAGGIRRVLLSGRVYAPGRVAAYVALAMNR